MALFYMKFYKMNILYLNITIYPFKCIEKAQTMSEMS